MCSLLQICVQYCIDVAYVVEIKLNSIIPTTGKYALLREKNPRNHHKLTGTSDYKGKTNSWKATEMKQQFLLYFLKYKHIVYT